MKSEELAAHTDLLTYVLQDYVHNRLTPRVVDIAYTAFGIAKRQNDDDGGPTDWFNDTRPTVMKAIDKLRKDLMEDRAKQSEQGIEPVNDDCAATGQWCGCVPHGEPVAYRWRQPIVDNKGITVGYTDWIYSKQKDFLAWWPHESLYAASQQVKGEPVNGEELLAAREALIDMGCLWDGDQWVEGDPPSKTTEQAPEWPDFARMEASLQRLKERLVFENGRRKDLEQRLQEKRNG